MPDERSGGGGAQERSLGKRLQHGFESKVLVPLAVTVVSTATSYLIKKLPMIVEEKVLPRLREQGRPETAREVVSETAVVVAEHVSDVVPGLGDGGDDGGDRGGDDGGGDRSQRRQPSNEDREEERRRREERRRERKRALQKA